MQMIGESTKSVQRKVKAGDLEAEVELGVRCLAGLFGCERDVKGAWTHFDHSKGAVNPRAGIAVDGVSEPESADDKEALAAMATNLGRWYADEALKAEDSFDPDFKTLRAYAEYWNILAINNDSAESLYILGRMYYLSNGTEYRKKAAMYLEFGTSVDSDFYDKCAEKLYAMLEHGWINPSWGCYIDTVNTLKERTSYDLSEYEGGENPDAAEDTDVLDTILENQPEYPMSVPGDTKAAGRPVRRSLEKILFSMGVQVDKYDKRTARFKIYGNEEAADYLRLQGYDVRESGRSYVVREK